MLSWKLDILLSFNNHPAKLIYLIFQHLRLCLATAIHNLKCWKLLIFV